jgi:hypothetical protein
MTYVIFDIDGTLANGKHREHLLPVNGGTWDDYFAKAGDDSAFFHMQVLIHALRSATAPKLDIVFVSGRPERIRGVTTAWLQDHYGCEYLGHTDLLMRADGDHRPDNIIKSELLDKVIYYKVGNPLIVFDDRNQVVNMWREHGLTCFQVAEGDF